MHFNPDPPAIAVFLAPIANFILAVVFVVAVSVLVLGPLSYVLARFVLREHEWTLLRSVKLSLATTAASVLLIWALLKLRPTFNDDLFMYILPLIVGPGVVYSLTRKHPVRSYLLGVVVGFIEWVLVILIFFAFIVQLLIW